MIGYKIFLTWFKMTLWMLSLSCVAQVAQPARVTFVLNAPGAPPYSYLNSQTNEYQGVVVDFFAALERSLQLEVVYLDSSRARSEKFLHEGKADIMLSSTAWLVTPEKLIYSAPLLKHQSYLYGLKPLPEAFSLDTAPRLTICTRRSYFYPILQPYFAQRKLMRADSSSQSTMVNMLVKNRCDLAIMNEYNALAIFNEAQFCKTTFYQSVEPISSVNLNFILRPELTDIQVLINQHLVKFIRSGELEQSMQRHAKKINLAKRNACLNFTEMEDKAELTQLTK
ncbi:ABC transporter substrate-binding protein [Aliiglaciecola sp. LCG003]|uniref:substrate-binding periplasmic protein n=1 Tax=Aliiglaciecola sp. LCG003 TaxID=3053655 RepID=UPI0025738F2D|nr:ABC transporter substrate-binding protein [Aliiglaciecola sp. LCG003]WJG08820.1 ABC transporter substrate-binding protein [Aliiglaciecola sp. LCG003]